MKKLLSISTILIFLIGCESAPKSNGYPSKFISLGTQASVDLVVELDKYWGVDYDKSIDEKKDLRSSVGLGLNWMTPIGPLSFSYAEPLSRNETDIIERFRFNLGTTF